MKKCINNMERSVLTKQESFIVFSRICLFICENYEKLQSEFSAIRDVLNTVESYGIAYKEQKTILFSIKYYVAPYDSEILSSIVNELEYVKPGSKAEFLQNINFIDLLDPIKDKKDRGQIVTFVWKARRILESIIYQIDRIKNTLDLQKQVAILKGMIAYY